MVDQVASRVHRWGLALEWPTVRAHIRAAQPTDVDDIHRLICELAAYEREPDAVVATIDDLTRALFDGSDTPTGMPALYGFVAEQQEQVVGIALWFLNYSTWRGRHGVYLEDLYVSPSHRGLGVGKALLAALAGVCLDNGYDRLEWSVLDWNTPAIEFYRSLGAVAMDEWTVNRLTGSALAELAGAAWLPDPGS